MFVMDLLMGIVGFILILAPFLFGFYGNLMATWGSIALGMMLFVNSCVQGMRKYDEDEDTEGAEQQE